MKHRLLILLKTRIHTVRKHEWKLEEKKTQLKLEGRKDAAWINAAEKDL